MRTAEFSRKTKLAAWEDARGMCDVCGKKLFPGDIFYDHIIPEAISKDNSLGNCNVLCRAHHDEKTRKVDVPTIAKTTRVRANHIGATKPKRPQSKWKRKMDGTVVLR